MHKLLERQIRRHLRPDGTVPDELRSFVQSVDQAYTESDADRALLERSLELSSQELLSRFQELRQQQREQQMIFDSVPAMIFYKDGENRILRLNQAAAHAMGRPINELVGRSAYELFPPDVAKALHDDDLAVMRSGRPKLGVIESQSNGDAQVHWVRTDKVPYRNDAGEVIGVIVFSLDISDRKNAEEKLQVAYQKMEQLVQFRTQFLNTTAHELRTPMTPIILQAHLLRETLFPLANDLERRGFDILERNINRLSRLVNDVLDAARLQAGRLQLRASPIDLHRLASEAVESFFPVAMKAGVSLELSPGPPVPLEGDAARLTQVVYNLLSNAIKFTPKGGRIDVSCAMEGNKALLRVQDSGIGLTPNSLSRLFQPFTQVHDPMQSTSPGTGLGLYVSKGIIDEHAGEIWADSLGPNRGAVFSFRIPLRMQAGGTGSVLPPIRTSQLPIGPTPTPPAFA
jgi:PAS domain S-box-containing protein